MTLPRSVKDARLEPQEPAERSMAGVFAAAFGEVARAGTSLRWPSPKYQKDPVAFARDIVAIELWEGQIDIATSVVENRQTSVRSGHKIGKSMVCAVLALWFFCSFPNAKVWLVAPTLDGIDDIIWAEIKQLLQRSGTCLDCRREAEAVSPDYPEYPRPCPHSAVIPEIPHVSSRDGLVSKDFRWIKGCTAEKPESMAGRSGLHILYIVDEASGVDDEIDDVIQGNLASKHARLVYISNPTKTEGFFYESHTKKKHLYRTFHIPSTRVMPLGRDDIGLADEEWHRIQIEKYGKDSGQYKVRVLGEFAPQQESKVIAIGLLNDAVARWATTPAEGPLHLGVDVALEGDDYAAIAPRRGLKVIDVVRESFSSNSQPEKAAADWIIEVAEQYRNPREPIVWAKVDSAGNGMRVIGKLHEMRPSWLRVVAINGGEKPRLPNEYVWQRDQMIFALRQWLRDGGAIPNNERLIADLHAPSYVLDVRGRKQVQSKRELRKELKRSTDEGDAVVYAVWDENEFASEAYAVPRGPAMPVVTRGAPLGVQRPPGSGSPFGVRRPPLGVQRPR